MNIVLRNKFDEIYDKVAPNHVGFPRDCAFDAADRYFKKYPQIPIEDPTAGELLEAQRAYDTQKKYNEPRALSAAIRAFVAIRNASQQPPSKREKIRAAILEEGLMLSERFVDAVISAVEPE